MIYGSFIWRKSVRAESFCHLHKEIKVRESEMRHWFLSLKTEILFGKNIIQIFTFLDLEKTFICAHPVMYAHSKDSIDAAT